MVPPEFGYFHTLTAGNGASGGHFLPQLRAAKPIIASNKHRIARFGVIVKKNRCQGYLKSDVGFFCFSVLEKGGCSKVLCGVFSFRAVWGKAVAVKFFVGFLSKGLPSKKPPVSE